MKKSFILSSLLSSCFMLFTIAANAAAPYVTTAPVSQTACAGTTAKFFVAVNDTTIGAPAINYKWQVSTDGGATWSTIANGTPYSNATTDTLSVITGMALNGYKYRSIDSNLDGMDTSAAATLTVVSPVSAGAITAPATLCVGSTVTLTDASSGGTWSQSNSAIATLYNTGVFTANSAGLDTISYIATNVCGTSAATTTIRVDAPVTAAPITGPTATCIGNTISLANANSANGTITWHASNSAATIDTAGMVMGARAGVDTITYTFMNACSTVTSTLAVTVESIANHGVISGPAAVCAGSGIHLSETVTGGFWVSSSSNAVVDGSGFVTGISAGTATIYYLFSNACGISDTTFVVTVDAPAAPITGGDSVGIHNVIRLFDAVPGGTWSTDGTGFAILDSSNVFTGIAAGTTVVTYTVTNLCGTSFAVVSLHVGAAPAAGTITGADSVCIGATITLAGTVAGGTWTSSRDTIAAIDPVTGVVTGIAAGYTIITYTVTDSFGSSTVTEPIFVTGRPVIRIFKSSIALGGNTITVYPAGGTFSETIPADGSFVATTYGSDSSGSYEVETFIASQPTATIHTTVDTNAHGDTIAIHNTVTLVPNTIHYSVTTSCGTTDSSFTYTIVPVTAVTNVNSNPAVLNVYPNPSAGAFTLSLTSATTETANITITNMVGAKVQEFTMTTNNVARVTLNQPAGIYFLTANTASGKTTTKITITN